MEQSLHLNLKQKMVMTPKMQQAVKILQISSQELHEIVEQEYSENPVLEFAEPAADATLEIRTLSAENIKKLSDYLGKSSSSGQSSASCGEGYDFKMLPSPDKNLAALLTEQAGLTFRDAQQRRIADYIIGCIDERGYLTASIVEIAHLLGLTAQSIEKVLDIIQTFEPAGVGARNLSECLRLQALNLNIYQGLIAAIIDKYLPFLAKNQLKLIASKENCEVSAVQRAADIVKSLDPKPGAPYSSERVKHVVPDIIVRKTDGKYHVFINEYSVPSLKISSLYRNTQNMDKKTKKYVEQRVSSAVWLINSIAQRKRTLYNVASQIVRLQQNFFDKGASYLNPLSMQTIAQILDIHESTVSRAIANKYMETPYGVISLKKFFSANVACTSAGETLIAGQIKNIIREMIEQENHLKPLSDQKICELLKKRDIDISRRTVMKYREQLGYQASAGRRQYQ